MVNKNIFNDEISYNFEESHESEERKIYEQNYSLRSQELNFESSLGVRHIEEPLFDEIPTGAPIAKIQGSLWEDVTVDNFADNVEKEDQSRSHGNESSSIDDQEILSLDELKEKLSNHIVPLEQLRPPAGVATGIEVIDDFLLWKGFPKGDLTLISGSPGTGATSLWLNAAAKVHTQKKWVAWINSECELMPNALIKKNIILDKLLVVKKPNESSQFFWILQEMISSTLFEMIGCHINENSLRSHQLQKLKKLARTYNVALVFISHSAKMKTSSLYSLMIDCQGEYFVIKRASHRPTPFTIPGGLVHADLMSQLTAESRTLLR
jgi:hypothetical protein